MRIERLEIAGFKSFPEPVALEFGDGATAVVGPNGCGKSNIADAVFWVLGELGAGTIRARGKDLIFSGSAERAPLGVAEVRLSVSGVSSSPIGGPPNEAYPTELPDSEAPTGSVVVTRRVDTSGQSTYEMDGRRCKRRDIQRLFAGTGLGPGSWALIEQGRANDVLRRKPDELRQLVEEAAGLGAYRLNGRESEVNLRAAETALARVRERLGELDAAIRVARRDSRNARRVRETEERIRLLEVARQAARRAALLARIADGSGPLDRIEAERGRRTRSLGAFERFIEELRGRSGKTDEELREAARRIGELGGRRDQADALLKEGSRSAALRAASEARLAAEAERLDRRAAEREAAECESAQRAREFPERLEELAAAAAEREAARGAASAGERRCREAVEEVRRGAEGLRATVNAMRLLAGQHDADRERIARAGLELAGARRELEGRLDHAERTGRGAEDQYREQAEEAVRLGAGLDRAEMASREAATAAADARNRESGARQRLEALRARLGSLRALLVSREQLGAGARRAAAAARRKQLSFQGVVGEGIEVDPGYELAAERLVGVHRIRLERAAEVPGFLEEIEGGEAGPCEILVSELARALAAAGRDRKTSGADRLREHVAATDPDLRASIPDALVMPDLETALAAFLDRPGHYVTPGGESVTPPGVVRVGRGGPGEGFLTTRREVADLEREEAAAASEFEEISREAGERGETAARAALAAEELRESHRRAESRTEQLRLRCEGSAGNLAEVRRRLDDLAAEDARNAEEAKRNEEAAAESRAALSRDEKRIETAARELPGLEEALAAARCDLGERERDWQEADRLLTREQAMAVEVARRAEAAEEQAAEDRARIAGIAGERVALAREGEEWRAREAAANSERSAARAEAVEWDAREERLNRSAEALRARLQSAVAAAHRRREELDALEERLAAAWDEVRSARSLLDDLEDEFRRSSGKDLAVAAAGLPPELRGRTRDDLAGEVESVRARLVELGPVNAIAEVRLEDLLAERRQQVSDLRDVEAGIADGREAMRRQERDARRIFRAAREELSAGFDEAFRQLFGGGRAELRLVEPKRPEALVEKPSENGVESPSTNGSVPDASMSGGSESRGPDPDAAAPDARDPDPSTGVEIAAQPPGKRLQTVRLLSGGEQALTALALLIALFRHRPAPFCLLDEVDAPLDDANVQRFAELLAELKETTQLVVITHNRLTMEACEHLYGVTMEEPGVSRLISANLDDDEIGDLIAETAEPAAGESASGIHA